MYKVLIIDNNKNDCTLLKDILLKYNPDFEVMISYCGAEGLEIINKEQPNIVFINMTLPILDGVEICNIIKNKLNIEIKTILISEIDSLERQEMMKLFLADEYISKPYIDLKIMNLLDDLLKRKECS